MTARDPAVIGVDGCRGGWIAAIWQGAQVQVRLFRAFADILAEEATIIAVDMPMGLPQRHGREAEQLARQALVGRKSSVFAVPSRAAIAEDDYAAACAANLRRSDPPRSIAKQSFHLFPKIREIDALLTPDLQGRIHEVHPELAFSIMNGGTAVRHGKKTPEGEAERREMLLQQGLPEIPEEAFNYQRQLVARDDVLDACAAAWSGRRILQGKARHFPAEEVRDARGLLMRIHA
jgi:predicted RNase H-like nuclease